ncbi:sigma-70 family RNA polymerase sigma factor [Actinoplanes sp. NPDC049596]|uniref:sigma-70 family RNA polymerase sigma factor n=1 Tax=unclassified Actinoplanes TaxID=2626549 RepID=UPI00342259CA
MTTPALERCPSPDEALIGRIWREHGAVMLGYAVKLTHDRSGAEDVVQEALVRAWRRAGDLDEERGSLRAWLLVVVRNIVTDRIRARAVRATEVGPSSVETAIGDHADRVVDTIVVAEGLSRLRPEQRDVIELLYLRGHSTADTAVLLDIPLGTVKSRAFYALRALRTVLSDLNEAVRGTSAS